MIDRQKFLDQTIKNDLRTYENTRKITTGQGNYCTTGCLLDYPYFKEHYKLTAINLSKQQAIDSDQKKYSKLILLEI